MIKTRNKRCDHSTFGGMGEAFPERPYFSNLLQKYDNYMSHIILIWKRVGIVVKFMSPDYDATRTLVQVACWRKYPGYF